MHSSVSLPKYISLFKMMLSYYAVYFFLLFLTTTAKAYTATDFILLSCGAASASNDSSSRSWDGDEGTRYAPSNAAETSLAAAATHMHPSVSQVPYETARIFTSSFTYTFPVITGSKFLRLYFYAADGYSSGHNTSLSFFSVSANGFTLLSNFSATLNSPSPSDPSFVREYIVVVEQNQRLNVTFTPNQGSFAFVNGIGIVSIPDKLYFKGNDVPIKIAGQLTYLKNDTALENVYRLNVGGSYVPIGDDSGPTRGMFRAWAQDDVFVYGGDYGYTPHVETIQIEYTDETPPYSAPETVYRTSRVIKNDSRSIQWRFPVDSGFYYLLRLHFCEIQLEVTEQNQRVFTISINDQTAEIQADVIAWTGGKGIPIYRDYMTWVSDDGRRGKKNLSLNLFPNMEGLPKYFNALLNGLEIFKLSTDTGRSLAAANPDQAVVPPTSIEPPEKNKKKNSGGSPMIYAIIGSVVGALAVVAAVGLIIFRRQRRVRDSDTAGAPGKSSWVPFSMTSSSTTRTSVSGTSLPSGLCRYFSLGEIKAATDGFDANFVIGKGGFGNVYRGLIDGGSITVAIKRLNPLSKQGAHEFLTEIEMLSKLRHVHLVSLIGYCNEEGEMILVYDYMAHGTLRNHLYGGDTNPRLTWDQRLRICIGAAKGLHYLHTGVKQPIIHRDVKSTNILLDDKWAAKVSDFGLSKVGPAAGGGRTHVSTAVKGSFGYVDPEYYRRQQLTDKSDLYSFGVVLFEVLCGRPAIVMDLPREQVNLAEWARLCCRKGTVGEIVDSNLDGQISPECLGKFVETAVMCLRDKGITRPSMSDVLASLEFAMQLQEEAEDRVGGAGFVGMSSPALPLLWDVGPDTTDDEMYFGSSDDVSVASKSRSSGLSTLGSAKLMASGEVFSEIKNPLAR